MPRVSLRSSMRVATLLLVSPLAQAVATPSSHPASPSAIAASLASIEDGSLWPGFSPKNTPLAIWDGQETHLFRHPSPPKGCKPENKKDKSSPQRCKGRLAGVVANSSAEIGGVTTATLVLDLAPDHSAADWAAIAAHEAFHVFQRERHPTWVGNEAELFTYPFDHHDLLSLRRLETAMLARALSAVGDERRAWAATFVAVRDQRYASLPQGAIGYERGTELNEGLARYVEGKARGEKAKVVADDYPAEAVRLRAYDTGWAIAALLDEVAPDWQKGLEAGDSRPLDRLLADALAKLGVVAQEPRTSERVAASYGALRDAELYQGSLARFREDFEQRPGFELTLDAAALALDARGFDPLNVVRLSDREVLHRRFVKLGNGHGEIEIHGSESLSTAAGAHPLFAGVSRLSVRGLAAEPKIREKDGGLTIEAPGIQGTFRGAHFERVGSKTVVTLAAPPASE